MKRFPKSVTLFALLPFVLAGSGCSQPPATTCEPAPIASESIEATYTVSFKNYDGTLLSESNVKAGDNAKYDGPTPTRPESDGYAYVFSGWDHPLENITSNLVFVAQYTETPLPVVNYFTVSFKNYDGTLLSESMVKSGEDAKYEGPTPTRPESDGYAYVFSGWDHPLENITSNLVFVAQYAETQIPVVRYYTATFKNYDGALLQESSVEEGHDAVYTGATPTRPRTPTHEYAFIGWDKPLDNIVSDTVFVAQFSENQTKYTVTFKNYDGTVLYETYVEKGEGVTYGGATPTKPENDEYEYSFSGWDHSLETITDDLVCVAQFQEIKKEVTVYHTVTFKNYDGTILQEVSVKDGEDATYTGAMPTRTDTPEFEYAFSGWDESLENIQSDCIRVAQYSTTPVEYTVEFHDEDDRLLYTATVHYQQPASYYGETPTKEATATHYYVFRGWDKDLSSITKSIITKPLFDEYGISGQIAVMPSNGENESVMEVTYDEPYDLGTPSFPGFIFLGWFVNGDTPIPASGVWQYPNFGTVTAKWENDYFEFSENEGNSYTVSLTEAGKNATEIIIPSTFNDKPVTTMGANFLRENANIERITIPGSIETIPSYSFYKCTKLSEVILDDGLKTIGSYAFDSCKIKTLTIPSTCTTIEQSAFEYNRDLCHAFIPSSVSSVGQYAFYACTDQTCICLEHTSTPSWGYNWNSGCIIYANCVKVVEGEDFNYVVRNINGDYSVIMLRLSKATSELQSYTFPTEIEGITDIRVGQYLFRNNLYIRSVDLTGITRIGANAFNGCTNLASVTFSDSLTVIGSYAFRYCSSLVRVEIPDSVSEIQSFAFDACSNLTYVYLPSATTTIGSYAFDECPKSTIYTNAHSASGGWASYWKGSQPIYYDYVSLEEEEDFNYVIQSYMGDERVTITSLKQNAYAKKNIVIPDEIAGISDIRLSSDLFKGLSDLISVDLGTGVTKIPTRCFSDCASLKTVVLHEGVTSIGDNAFYKCANLTSISMPSTLTTIGRQAFDYCTSLREIVIPLSVSTIDAYAFDVTGGSLALLIEASVAQPGWKSYWSGSSANNKQFIYDYVSSGVSGDFRYAKTSNGVTDSIYILGLAEGSSNVNLVVPDQIENISNIKIANYAFDGNTLLKSIDLGNSVTYVGSYAFRGNISLRSVIIPSSCTVIKAYAFQSCSTACVLNCEAESLPSTWESNWNYSSCQVVWGYTR